MEWNFLIYDPHSRGARPTQIPRQLSGQVTADSYEEALEKVWAKWDEEFGPDTRPPDAVVEVNPARR